MQRNNFSLLVKASLTTRAQFDYYFPESYREGGESYSERQLPRTTYSDPVIRIKAIEYTKVGKKLLEVHFPFLNVNNGLPKRNAIS